VPATVGAEGTTPEPVAPLEPLYAGLVAHVTAYEDLALEAAVKGGSERVFRALLAHPLVGQISIAQELTDKLLAHNKAYLPWAR
jgi:6-phospho-beta-glucosidase